MNNQYQRQFETLLRVRAFGDKYSDLFPPTSLSGRMFATIASAITELSQYAGTQAAGFGLARESVTAKAEAREILRECLVAIARTAGSIDREHPGVVKKFRLPRKVSDGALISGARGFAENVESMKEVFVAYEMSPDFVHELHAAIHGLETAVQERTNKKGRQIAATLSIEDTMDKAMDALYRLDGMAPNKLGKDYPKLKEWELARRVQKARVSKSSEPEPSDPAVTVPPTAA